MVNKKRLIDQLIIHEGLRLKPYKCTSEKLTIGVGRNLDDVGITREEAMYLLENDIARIAGSLYSEFDWFNDLNEHRKEAVINIVFNIGLGSFKKFKKTIAYIEDGKFDLAGAELLDSRYAKQVGNRAIDVANQLAGS